MGKIHIYPKNMPKPVITRAQKQYFNSVLAFISAVTEAVRLFNVASCLPGDYGAVWILSKDVHDRQRRMHTPTLRCLHRRC